ncbi:endonuclease domain-containing protein [Lacunimicrobium album]
MRNRKVVGTKFRREVVIGPYLVDFACHELSLIIEIDGSSHDTKGEYDKARQSWLEEQGFRVIRFSHLDVMKELHAVIDGIEKAVQEQKLTL